MDATTFYNLVTPGMHRYTEQANAIDRETSRTFSGCGRHVTDAEISVFVIRFMDAHDTDEIGNYPEVLQFVRDQIRRIK